jgi:hypothetical protein
VTKTIQCLLIYLVARHMDDEKKPLADQRLLLPDVGLRQRVTAAFAALRASFPSEAQVRIARERERENGACCDMMRLDSFPE